MDSAFKGMGLGFLFFARTCKIIQMMLQVKAVFFFCVSFNKCSLLGNASSVSLPNGHNVKEGIVPPTALEGYGAGLQKHKLIKLKQKSYPIDQSE